jgi:hypothetical protein
MNRPYWPARATPCIIPAMTAHPDDAPERAGHVPAEPPSAFDLDAEQFEQFNQELERIFGPAPEADGTDRPSRKMMWVLPAPTFEEAMTLLRDVPSGSGEAGLNRLLQERFPALSEPDDDTWADDPAGEGDEDDDASGTPRAGGA